jgi:hypothetical protein
MMFGCLAAIVLTAGIILVATTQETAGSTAGLTAGWFLIVLASQIVTAIIAAEHHSSIARTERGQRKIAQRQDEILERLDRTMGAISGAYRVVDTPRDEFASRRRSDN